MKVTVNGKARDVANGASNDTDVSSFLRALDVNPRLVAVAVNGDVIPKDQYDSARVHEGDAIEVVRMVGGGAR
jgi:sulfur carrier protein